MVLNLFNICLDTIYMYMDCSMPTTMHRILVTVPRSFLIMGNTTPNVGFQSYTSTIPELVSVDVTVHSTELLSVLDDSACELRQEVG